MSFKFMAITPVLAMSAAAAAIALGAPASAAPSSCTNSGTATVCEAPGSASVVAEPSTGTSGGVGSGANEQNGSYGPAGNLPPVGGK